MQELIMPYPYAATPGARVASHFLLLRPWCHWPSDGHHRTTYPGELGVEASRACAHNVSTYVLLFLSGAVRH